MERLEQQAAEREAKKAHAAINKVFGGFVVDIPPQKTKPKKQPSRLQCLPKNVRNPFASKFVYLMKNEEHGVFKIGFSDDVEKRRRNIEGEIPIPFIIEIVQAWETYHFTKLESALHKLFADKHVKGEWFRLSQTDVEECFRFVETWLVEHPSVPVISA